jgi:hypothetical protein
VANRSGEHVSSSPEPKGSGRGIRAKRLGSPEDGFEATVHLKVSYKTVVLVAVVFDIIHLSIRELFSSSLGEQFLSLF